MKGPEGDYGERYLYIIFIHFYINIRDRSAFQLDDTEANITDFFWTDRDFDLGEIGPELDPIRSCTYLGSRNILLFPSFPVNASI